MIIDSNLIFTADAVHTNKNSNAVALTSFSHPSRMGHIPIIFRVTEDFNNLTHLNVSLEQSQTENGIYTAVNDTSFSIVLADLKAGENFGWRCLPNGIDKPWLRLVYEIEGILPTQGKIFAAITAEVDEPYTVDMHVKV